MKNYIVGNQLQEFEARRDGAALTKVDGYRVSIKGFEQWEFFIYQDITGVWHLVEKSICMSIPDSKSGLFNTCLSCGVGRLQRKGVKGFGKLVTALTEALRTNNFHIGVIEATGVPTIYPNTGE